MKKQRIWVFVDGSNFYHRLIDLVGHAKFGNYALFLHWLKTCGVDYKLGYFQKDGFSEKGVDVKIAVDMIKFAYENRYDKAFLVSGDGDLVGAVDFVRELGKQICNLIFCKGDMFSYRLRRACNRYFYIDRQVTDFIKKNRQK